MKKVLTKLLKLIIGSNVLDISNILNFHYFRTVISISCSKFVLKFLIRWRRVSCTQHHNIIRLDLFT